MKACPAESDDIYIGARAGGMFRASSLRSGDLTTASLDQPGECQILSGELNRLVRG